MVHPCRDWFCSWHVTSWKIAFLLVPNRTQMTTRCARETAFRIYKWNSLLTAINFPSWVLQRFFNRCAKKAYSFPLVRRTFGILAFSKSNPILALCRWSLISDHQSSPAVALSLDIRWRKDETGCYTVLFLRKSFAMTETNFRPITLNSGTTWATHLFMQKPFGIS